MSKNVAFVAPLPPPVHGFSNICAAMAELLAARTTVRVFNRAPRSDNRLSSRLRPLTNLIGNFLWCLRTRNTNLYVGLSGGRGQWLDLAHVLSAKVCGHRMFVHHHSFAYINAPSFVNRLLFKIVRHETHVVLSRRMGEELIRLYQLDPAKVRVVSNAAFFAPVEENLRIPEAGSPVCVGFLSAVSFEKGIGEFFSVLAELKRAGIPYVGRVAGPLNPAMRPQFEALLGSSSDVTYLGPIYDEAKTAFYRDLDVLLFPTDYANEAEPLVIHEAMRSGVHVIACDRGAISEMLTHGAGVVCAKSSFVATAFAQIRAFNVRCFRIAAGAKTVVAAGAASARFEQSGARGFGRTDCGCARWRPRSGQAFRSWHGGGGARCRMCARSLRQGLGRRCEPRYAGKSHASGG